jgi:chromosome segregation ATPase
MRKLKRLLVGSMLVAPLCLANVFAIQSTFAAKNTLATRISQYKSGYGIKLSFAQLARLKLRCSAAQGKVHSLSGRIKGIETSRNEVYKNITDQLASLQTRLQQKDIDTTELQANIATLRTKIDGYKTDLTTYKQRVSDVAALDCKADPSAFKAALEAARAARLKVASDIKDIHDYLTGTVRASLVKLHDKVKATQ